LAGLREHLKSALRSRAASEDPAAFSYRIHWLAEARQWTPARQSEILELLRPLMNSPGFRAGEAARMYEVPGLDLQRHAGVSLFELSRVLEALMASPPDPGGDHG
jgi:hypothetical protein